jgi:hypothetical protein
MLTEVVGGIEIGRWIFRGDIGFDPKQAGGVVTGYG